MRPTLFEVFGFEVRSFGVMFALAVVVGIWLTLDGIERSGKDSAKALTVLMLATVGGYVGARIWWVVEGLFRGTLASAVVAQGLSSGGLTWNGGLALGLAVALGTS